MPEKASHTFPFESIPENERVVPELQEERVAEDPNAEPDSDEEDVESLPQGWTPTPEQLRDLKIAHDNSGHPTNADFA